MFNVKFVFQFYTILLVYPEIQKTLKQAYFLGVLAQAHLVAKPNAAQYKTFSVLCSTCYSYAWEMCRSVSNTYLYKSQNVLNSCPQELYEEVKDQCHIVSPEPLCLCVAFLLILGPGITPDLVSSLPEMLLGSEARWQLVKTVLMQVEESSGFTAWLHPQFSTFLSGWHSGFWDGSCIKRSRPVSCH